MLAGQDFAARIWVVDPAFMLDLACEQLRDGDPAPAREEAYVAGARLDDDELRDAASEDADRRARARARAVAFAGGRARTTRSAGG